MTRRLILVRHAKSSWAVEGMDDHAQFSRYPTGATAVFDIDIDDWRSLGWRTAVLRDFVVPRELPES